MDRILIDSSAFIAWSSEHDIHYKGARETYHRLIIDKMPLVTTNLIANETYTWLQRSVPRGHHEAVKFGNFLRQVSAGSYPVHLPNYGLLIVYSNPQIERLAWDIFLKYDTAGFSFTDCVSFAIMQELDIKQAFTYDRHFEVMGFELIG